jgi:hypothetical protein
MKTMPGKFLAGCRVVSGPLASTKEHRMNGMFRVPFIRETGLVAASLEIFKSLMEREHGDGAAVVYFANCLASDGGSWDHVSVSIDDQRRDPTWMEMSQVKDLFFDEHEAVMQFHPPKAARVNFHPHCLHLWRSQTQQFTLPPGHFIGPVETSPELKARNEALASLDEQRIRDYFASVGKTAPSHPETFWLTIHKIIVNIPELPHEIRARSDAWLAERGYSRSLSMPGRDVVIAMPMPFAKAKV